MEIKIALAGNPNSGKTTLFNALTGSNQFVGNWPGVTVEKKEGKLKKHDGVTITDLPGIYSLSPYTLEEVVARNYLLNEKPNAILNIIDGTNLERNLYLTTQLIELGIPVVVAINMSDVVKKNGDEIDSAKLSKDLGCKVVEISALKGTGIMTAAEAAIDAAKEARAEAKHKFCQEAEDAISKIGELIKTSVPVKESRWYAVKLFERDEKVVEALELEASVMEKIEDAIKVCENALDDDSESIITNERYVYISSIIKHSYKKKSAGKMTVSDKIDRIVTNRWLALPIFAIIMFVIYFISVTTVGTWVTDWANDGVFGDGFHLVGIDGGYAEKSEEYGSADTMVNEFLAQNEIELDENLTAEQKTAALKAYVSAVAIENGGTFTLKYIVVSEEDLTEEEMSAGPEDIVASIDTLASYGYAEPAPEDYGVWIHGIPALLDMAFLDDAGEPKIADWLYSLIMDGIVGGVGAVLGFVPQILVLFILLAFLESCGYMARVAFVMDRIFRKFGLSGKSFIPMLIGTGCGIPGIMASRTIENQRDRRMTIMTTTFIPCGAKLPFIAMIAGAIFGGAWWVAPFAYFLGMGAIIISGIMLKKTKPFEGDPAPFIMELPSYHMPSVGTLLRSMWERGWSFIKKAGTIILLSTIVIWFLTNFGINDGFKMLGEEDIDKSFLAMLGNAIAWIFAPIGFGSWEAAISAVTGLVAKENIVATMGVIFGDIATIGSEFTGVAGLSFLIFNLLCAPCFAAIGAIKREMNNTKWTWFAIGYQCGFAYIVSLIVYWFGSLFTGALFGTISAVASVFGLLAAVIALAGLIYMIVRPASFSLVAKAKALIKKN